MLHKSAAGSDQNSCGIREYKLQSKTRFPDDETEGVIL